MNTLLLTKLLHAMSEVFKSMPTHEYIFLILVFYKLLLINVYYQCEKGEIIYRRADQRAPTRRPTRILNQFNGFEEQRAMITNERIH